MTPGTEKWSDLAVRLASGAAMVIFGFFAVWVGGWLFYFVVAVVCGLMVWELTRMVRPDVPETALQLGLLGGAVSLVAIAMPDLLAIPVLLLPALVGYVLLTTFRLSFAALAALVLLAGYSVMSIRAGLGFDWMLWLVLVVVVTDVLGYFAGRLIGGPKFWQRVSPKKTWAGTVFGWLGAALVGMWYMLQTGGGAQLIVVSVAVSMASQMGDIAESAMKRRVGVKDSSNLIPGHGGLMDRFDGMLGAAIFLLVVGPFIVFPAGLG